jgi:murein DD-endopeptidase MepM/ murein hydrolase activator NlpD
VRNPYDNRLRTDTHEDHLARNYDPYPPSLGGDDFAYPRLSAVRSPGAGFVDLVDNDTRGTGGRMVGVNHGGGLRSEQLHLARIDARVGDQVAELGHLGLSGSSANGSEYGVGAHIHAHFILNGTRLGWVNYLAAVAPAITPSTTTRKDDDMRIHRRTDNNRTYLITAETIHHVSATKELPALRLSATGTVTPAASENLSKDDFRIVIQALGWPYDKVAKLANGETLHRNGTVTPRQVWPAVWS